MFRAVTGLSFLKRHPQSSFRLTSNEIEVPTTNVKDLKGSNEDMKELVVKDKFVVVHWNGLRFPGLCSLWRRRKRQWSVWRRLRNFGSGPKKRIRYFTNGVTF
ncbi:hypothetical protein J6590_080119 [Homalodisca vitripennis]|nr:hypothetical protein J6590_065799 [Homalodisca vitripennis]KAG8295447.1 hypothetical protein J6590_080119 [Homalodisca vitripennis]